MRDFIKRIDTRDGATLEFDGKRFTLGYHVLGVSSLTDAVACLEGFKSVFAIKADYNNASSSSAYVTFRCDNAAMRDLLINVVINKLRKRFDTELDNPYTVDM